ncbi:sialate O-acetylesterase [Rhodopirellula sp. MGV]|uniref:sialate O-acetylesterase n=1 Tax=Rhodopirellula sp. MGV TaxID=2023130 RepID=UPI000B966E3F|nr:sialate O-acetylesterase [Rhodopirellula sp. MGV]OYP37258.1 sialate O-acetylesterase [Rhodopirellula sp. MGV]PNY33821.1 sialate O-acetylesterase [Rhodopirellula baltica]
MRLTGLAFLLLAAFASQCSAEIRTSAVFGDSMVLQRNKPIHVWGWADAGSSVEVKLADATANTKTDESGRFDVELPKLPAGGPFELTINAGDDSVTYSDVLIGEVWVCSGQSNMGWSVQQSNDADLESLSANYPNIRLISVPQVGVQEPQQSFDGRWQACTPETVKQFSGVGYFFGRQLHQTLDVPVGLIDNAWGGSSAEAWVKRDLLEANDNFDELMARWEHTEATYDHDAEVKKFQENLAKWRDQKNGPRPNNPRNPLTGQHRPANLYNGVLYPIIGYTIEGVVWYQGESNAGRAYQYRELFPLMIQHWRDEWKQDDFSFYWVQLADFMAERDEPTNSAWAELREAQTMTMDKLENTGEAVIIELGEASDIHPKNKQDVGKRLARWALAKNYGYDIPYRSPTYESMSVDGDQVTLKFDHVGGGLDTFDVRDVIGFTIAGEDKSFVQAEAKITGKDTVVVSSDKVSAPAAVRYAWADNPICNVQSQEGLPMTPFRTDDWKGVTADAK